MKHSILAAALALALAGCGQQQKSQPQANAPAVEAARTYSGAGKVTAVAGYQVSFSFRQQGGVYPLTSLQKR
ncbi:MAG: hypothetical protein HOP96_03005 [Sphingomonas sp.]|nr:hypothetical protein [Sphingomonas sp.]